MSDMRRALEALADKMEERCGDHCPNNCPMCEARNDLRLILARTAGITTWEERVRLLESEGLTRSDAQAVVDAEDGRRP